ncbi:MAG: acyl-CoA thioesterase [Gemmatimonadetes bacterium]|nr:acyl-CoA thioesterase [Gemmatimonadota bacterium]
MNLLFRLIWTAIARRWRAAVPPLGPCATPFRVLPTDLDVLFHVNNGVYLSMMDVARVDLMYRAGLMGRLTARRWYPVVVAETIRFRKSLQLFDRFTIDTRVIGWDEKALLLQQDFVRRGEVIATATVRSRFLIRGGGSVAPSDLAVLASEPAVSPPLSEAVARWNADQASDRSAT